MKTILRFFFYCVCYISKLVVRDSGARVLMYHSITKENVFFNVSMKDFIWQIEYLERHAYRFFSLQELVHAMKEGRDLRKVIVLTFDDAHRDFMTIVLPYVTKKNIPVTVFWPTRMPGNSLMTSTGVLCDILSRDEIVSLTSNFLCEIGSHTCSHPDLTTLNREQVATEIQNSYHDVAMITQKPVAFAYPKGRFFENDAQVVRDAGYYAAVTTHPGIVTSASDVCVIPRISIDSVTSRFVFQTKLSTLYSSIKK